MDKGNWRVIATDKPNEVGYQYLGENFSFLIIQTRSREELTKTIQLTIFIAKNLKTPLTSSTGIGITHDFRLNQTYFFTQEVFLDNNGRIKPVFKANNLADDDKDVYPNIIGLKAEYPWINQALEILNKKIKSASKLQSKDFYPNLLSILKKLRTNY